MSNKSTTDVAINQSLYRLFHLLTDATLAMRQQRAVNPTKHPQEYEELETQTQERVLAVEQFLHQELGPYADHILLHYSIPLGSYGPHPMVMS